MLNHNYRARRRGSLALALLPAVPVLDASTQSDDHSAANAADVPSDESDPLRSQAEHYFVSRGLADTPVIRALLRRPVGHPSLHDGGVHDRATAPSRFGRTDRLRWHSPDRHVQSVAHGR